MSSQTKTGAGETARAMYCSLVSRESGEDPIGTAPSHARYLLVEVPLPWECQVEESKHFPPGLAEAVSRFAAAGKPCRLLAFASDAYPVPPGFRRVMYYERPEAPFAFFGKQEYIVPETHLTTLAQALLAGDDNERLSAFSEYAERSNRESRDLFVCTHGSHDRCCGKFGFPLYQTIMRRYASHSPGKLRVWRTSHFGGHRHAPTLVDFPEGRYWAHLREELLDALILRQGGVDGLARHYRGWGGADAFGQVAERAVFLREGWDWIALRKQAEVLTKDETSAKIRIDYWLPDGSVAGSYEAQISIAAPMRTGGCGDEPGEARQYGIDGLRHLSP